MAGTFSASIVERAWDRSKGSGECGYRYHGHEGRCNAYLIESFREDQQSEYGWTVCSRSGKFLDVVSDCLIICFQCYRLMSFEVRHSDLWSG